MMVVSISLIIPTMVSINMDETKPVPISRGEIIFLSHGTAIVLLILFFVYMIFRLQTHKSLFSYGQYEPRTGHQGSDNMVQEDPDASLGIWTVCCILITTTAPACVCVWYLLDSVDGMAEARNMSKEFIGFILIPAVGNAAKCITIAASSRRSIDLAIRTIMSSVLNNLLFMFPFSILLGWIAGRPMYLNFDQFEATVFFLAIIVMTCLIQYGKTNYFEGAMLIGT
jgi:Ca2+:H+ antiporter